jgi:uncharacterized membrane protein YphA (DoxX/SURF4 family)
MIEPVSSVVMQREPGAWTRSLIALLLRLTLGLLFLTAGLSKFDGIKKGTYPTSLTKPFESTRLHPAAVRQFADILPYAEAALGGLLIAGLFTPLVAALTGALLLGLFFGTLILGDSSRYPGMVTYLLANAAVLWLSPVTSNYLSLDGLIFGWWWKPRTEGTYHRD